MRNVPTVVSRQNVKMGLEKLGYIIVKRYLCKSFGHILKVNDVKHHISRIQPDLTILKAPKREMKIWSFLNGKILGKKAVFSSRV
jgi:hypothetical protein